MGKADLTHERGEPSAAMRQYRTAFIGVAISSAILNLLVLGGSIYMMLVYDMAIPSRSLPTLLALLAMVILVYSFQGILEYIRSQILSQIGAAFARTLAPRVHDCLLRLPLVAPHIEPSMPQRDLDTIRSFLASGGPAAIIDLPWVIVFIGILSIFHPLLGLTAFAGAVVLVVLTIVADRLTARLHASATGVGAHQAMIRDANISNAESVAAMGLQARMTDRWVAVWSQHLHVQTRLARLSTSLSSASRTFRMFLQSGILSVGAYLVIEGSATGGVIFASSILSARALAPVDTALANWRGVVGARKSWHQLTALMAKLPPAVERVALHDPCERLTCHDLTVRAPGASTPSVSGVSFTVEAGQVIAIVGPSASGKSSLVRGLLGLWPTTTGDVRLDGATFSQWNAEHLGRNIGYMAQDAQLMPGSVAENIARFDPAASADDIIAAARAAEVHDMILSFPDGYDTRLEERGFALSGGQRQRIALARALYRDPFLVVLDEPNSSLDREGEAALSRAISAVRERNGIALIIAHRKAILNIVDAVIVLREGRIEYMGHPGKMTDRITPADRIHALRSSMQAWENRA